MMAEYPEYPDVPDIRVEIFSDARDGYTPQRGIDYWTEEDVAEMRSYVDQRVEESGAAMKPTLMGLPILYLTGDTTGISKDNAVTLDYTYGDRSGICTLKWQGSGSIGLGQELGTLLGDPNNGKMNYTIKFDEAFEAKSGWGEQKKYCLKANVADFSHARNLCATKIWAQMSACRESRSLKLYKTPNWGAVDGFPMLVVLNGDYRGLYTWNIPKDGWMLGMGSGDKEAIVCAEEGADFSAAIVMDKTFTLEYATDEDNSGWVKESLDAIVTAIQNGDWATFQTLVDVDSAIDYLLAVAKCTGGDAMTRNFLLHTYDGVKWAFTPYDADTWFGIEWGGAGHVADDVIPKIGDFESTSKLMQMIIKRVPEKIASRYRQLRKKILSASNITEILMDYGGQIPKVVFDEEVRRWPGIKTTSTNNVLQMVDHVRAREAIIDAEIERIDAPMLKAAAAWFNADTAGIEKTALTAVHFDADYEPTGAEKSWDCSLAGDGSIMAYLSGTVVTVKPTKHRYIKLNPDSSNFFQGCTMLTTITGTEMFTANIGTTMLNFCQNCNRLTTPVYIPFGVTNINRIFHNTWYLRTSYDLPNGLMYMVGAFSGGGLLNPPAIPKTVLEMGEAFYACPMTDFPYAIPESVTGFSYAFKQCYKLGGLIEINAANITSDTQAFYQAGRDTGGIILVGSNTQLAQLAATGEGGNVTVGV